MNQTAWSFPDYLSNYIFSAKNSQLKCQWELRKCFCGSEISASLKSGAGFFFWPMMMCHSRWEDVQNLSLPHFAFANICTKINLSISLVWGQSKQFTKTSFHLCNWNGTRKYFKISPIFWFIHHDSDKTRQLNWIYGNPCARIALPIWEHIVTSPIIS